MARAIWRGSVTFGLVNVPVGLYTATEDRTVHFNQFQAGTSDRIRYKRVNERTGREVELGDIVRGHEVSKDDYVLVTDEELAAVDPGGSRTIDIADFVELAEIDPIYFQKTYYLAPQGEGAMRAYALLHRAMTDTGKAGIAAFVMHGKQYLAAIRAMPDVLALETMFFADEVRDPREDRGSAAPGGVPRPRADDRQTADRFDDDPVEPAGGDIFGQGSAVGILQAEPAWQEGTDGRHHLGQIGAGRIQGGFRGGHVPVRGDAHFKTDRWTVYRLLLPRWDCLPRPECAASAWRARRAPVAVPESGSCASTAIVLRRREPRRKRPRL